MGLRVCLVNISPSFNKLTLTFVDDFPSTAHPHTYFFPKNTHLLVNVLVSGEEPLLVRRILIKTPLGKPQRLLVKLLLLLLNNKGKISIVIYFNDGIDRDKIFPTDLLLLTQVISSGVVRIAWQRKVLPVFT